MEVPPTAGWFISWKILFKWDGFGVPLFQETSIYGPPRTMVKIGEVSPLMELHFQVIANVGLVH